MKKTLAWGDMGDGYYQNPVLNADYSDPDVIRVGNDFYMVCSEFHYMGIPVLHSTDLVNWTLVGRVYDHFDGNPGYSEMRMYGQGSWAPAIRFHDGYFYVYFNTPVDGLFMYRTKDVRAKWEGPFQLSSQHNCEDPCPLWDDDGKAYLGHSVLKGGPIIIREMSPDGTKLLDPGRVVHWGPVAEGTKLHKFGKYYYISIPEGGVGRGWQTVLRSEYIYGPYESKITLEEGSSQTNGPHQGAIVDTPQGEWWFLHFQETGASPKGKLPLGRVMHLQPVEWQDGWPMMGVEKNGKREPVERHVKPKGLVSERFLPQTSDDFSKSTLAWQWAFNHNPLNSHWSLTEEQGLLRIKPHGESEPMKARNTVTQKVMGEGGYAEVVVHPGGMTPDQCGGLVFISKTIQGAFVKVAPDGQFLVETRVDVPGSTAQQIAVIPLKAGVGQVRLRVDIDVRGASRFSYCYGDLACMPLPGVPTLSNGYWKGVKLGLCATGPEGGHVDFSDFVYVVE
jgi:beta-xylosidase